MIHAYTTITHIHNHADGEGNQSYGRHAFEHVIGRDSYYLEKSYHRSGSIEVPLCPKGTSRVEVVNQSEFPITVRLGEDTKLRVPAGEMIYLPRVEGESMLILLQLKMDQKVRVFVSEGK